MTNTRNPRLKENKWAIANTDHEMTEAFIILSADPYINSCGHPRTCTSCYYTTFLELRSSLGRLLIPYSLGLRIHTTAQHVHYSICSEVTVQTFRTDINPGLHADVCREVRADSPRLGKITKYT